MNRLFSLCALAALVLLGCPNADLVVVNFCDLPAANCSPCAGDICADLHEQRWCCNNVADPEGNNCTPVAAFAECDLLNQYAVFCAIGQSVPQTNPDGTDGFECYG